MTPDLLHLGQGILGRCIGAIFVGVGLRLLAHPLLAHGWDTSLVFPWPLYRIRPPPCGRLPASPGSSACRDNPALQPRAGSEFQPVATPSLSPSQISDFKSSLATPRAKSAPCDNVLHQLQVVPRPIERVDQPDQAAGGRAGLRSAAASNPIGSVPQGMGYRNPACICRMDPR
jgi:hypothetical protein